jgi:2-hydroxychromene-2-carboxylate isomerase
MPRLWQKAFVAHTIARLDEVLRETGLSQNAWGKAHGFSSKQMSQVRNHDRVVAAGVRGAPQALIERMADILGVETIESAA